MPHHSLIAVLACLLAFTVTGAAAATESRKVYKWLDSQGNLHYGDRQPDDPQATGRQVLNANGVVVQHLDRQPDAETAVQRREMLRSGNRDVALVTSFNSENELREVHDESLALLRSSIAISESNANRLRAHLETLETQHARMKAAGQTIPAQETSTAQQIRSTLGDQELELDKLRRRQQQLETEYAREVKRYRELTAETRSSE